MLFALVLTLAAAPRADGVWLPSKLALKALAGTASDLDLGAAVVFSATEVNVGYGQEDETRAWRETEAGLEVRSGDEWRKLQWKALRDGVVKTDVKQQGTLEELTFVAKSVSELKRERAEKLKGSLLAKTQGRWAAGTRALELGASSTLDGKLVPVRATPCNLRCEGRSPTPCADVGELGDSHLFLLQGKRLVEVALQGDCGEGGAAGVELVEGGLTFERAK